MTKYSIKTPDQRKGELFGTREKLLMQWELLSQFLAFPNLNIFKRTYDDNAFSGLLLLFLAMRKQNIFGRMHGGAVASVAEEVSMACARTVVGEEKELFLGEISISYLSSAPRNAELKIDASLTRSGRNLTMVAAEFRLKNSGKLTYTSRATFYSMPVASL